VGAEHSERVWIGRACEGFLPTRNPLGKRAVDILKRLLGGGASRRIRAMAQAIEGSASLDGLLGFERQECILESSRFIVLIDLQGCFEFVAGIFVFARFQKRVGEIFVPGGTLGLLRESFTKELNRRIVVLLGGLPVGFIQFGIAGRLRVGGRRRRQQNYAYKDSRDHAAH